MPTWEQQEISQLKGRLAHMEARLDLLYRHLDVTFVEDTRLEDDPKVIAALKANSMVAAIKLHRAATNTTMEAARAGIEEMRVRLGIQAFPAAKVLIWPGVAPVEGALSCFGTPPDV